MAVAKRSYAPTRGELTTAIADLLEEVGGAIGGRTGVMEVLTSLIAEWQGLGPRGSHPDSDRSPELEDPGAQGSQVCQERKEGEEWRGLDGGG